MKLFVCIIALAFVASTVADVGIPVRDSADTSPYKPGSWYGVDVSSPVSVSEWECLLSNSNRFAVVRCYQSSGTPDPNCADTVANAWTAKLDYVDLYHFPDTSQSATTQIEDSLANIAKYKIKYNVYWLDIEIFAWGSNPGTNVAFIQDMITALQKGGVKKIGIYTSEYNWSTITANSDAIKDVSLWYADWDYYYNFNDFKPFGAWKAPTMKQWQGGSTTICGVGVDIDWRPDMDSPIPSKSLLDANETFVN